MNTPPTLSLQKQLLLTQARAEMVRARLAAIPFFGAWRIGWECDEGYELLGSRPDLAAKTSPPSPSYRGFQIGDVERWKAERAALRLAPAKDSCGYIWDDRFEAEAALETIVAFF